MKAQLNGLLEKGVLGKVEYRTLRAILHKGLGIPDYVDRETAISKVEHQPALLLTLFAVYHSVMLRDARRSEEARQSFELYDVVRIYIFVLSTRYPGSRSTLRWGGTDVLDLFRNSQVVGTTNGKLWSATHELHQVFYAADSGDEGAYSVESFRTSGWRLPQTVKKLSKLRLTFPRRADARDYEHVELEFERAPIEWTVATGQRSENLVEYLEGCEFVGAEHLRHPFLIHLYAQQVLLDFIRKGVLYAELRGSPDGYVSGDIQFEFPHACRCLVESFSQAQDTVLTAFDGSRGQKGKLKRGSIAHLLGNGYSLLSKNWVTQVAYSAAGSGLGRYVPCKVVLIFVGKRHKPTREMILETPAAAVMKPASERAVSTAKDFVTKELGRSRVVGFDLAGKEVGNPPELFEEEFTRLSKLPIPLTVHAERMLLPNLLRILSLNLERAVLGMAFL
jgi:hypothetical protein